MIDAQYEKLKLLQKLVDSYGKEFEKESEKYLDMLDNSQELELSKTDLRMTLESLYGDTCNIEPIRFGFKVTWFKDIVTEDDEDFLGEKCEGFGVLLNDIIREVKKVSLNSSLGLKITDYEMTQQHNNPWDDGYRISSIDIVMTQGYMDKVNKTKRIPKLNLKGYNTYKKI